MYKIVLSQNDFLLRSFLKRKKNIIAFEYLEYNIIFIIFYIVLRMSIVLIHE